MQEERRELTSFFEPGQWSSIYEYPSNQGFIFRRGAELVEGACTRLARAGTRWLDVGCGTGHLTANLSRLGLCIIGVDHDPMMVNYAKERFSSSSRTLGLKFINAKAESLPFEDNSFDGIVAASLMGCVASPELVCSEFYRVLRNNGVAIITFTNSDSILLKTNWYLNLIFRKRDREIKNNTYRLYSIAHAEHYLKGAGFAIRDVRYYNSILTMRNWLFPSKGLSTYLEGVRWKRLSRLGRNFLLFCEKRKMQLSWEGG